MNTQKYGIGNSGLLNEVDRSMYKNKDTVSKSLIDRERTHLNYNLCPHPQYSKQEIIAIQERIRGKKMRKDGILFGSTILTLPKDFQGDEKEFFKSAYENLKKIYGLRDEDVVSAYVHLDESTPHLHFYFICVSHQENGDKISWDSVFPRRMYKTQHKLLKKEMEKDLGIECNILNGETLGIDILRLGKEDKMVSMVLTNKKEKLDELKEEVITIQIQKQELQEDVTSLTKEVKNLQVEKLSLTQAINDLIESIKEFIIQRSGLNKVLRTPFIKNREDIESRLYKVDTRQEATLNKDYETVDDVLNSFEVVKSNNRVLGGLRAATKKEDYDFDTIDDLLDR